ncbi:MAG: cytidine deaminase [Calothrix sp. SM1_5_4]|nr:cytidine deaminase [Calothrix sp. SM1_5_4]
MQTTQDPAVQDAYQVALKARLNSHSPYSKFKVGAALKLEGVSEALPGCNVENASYGATICAERTALAQAVARFGVSARPEFLVIVTAEEKATVPCGLCLQVLAEFCADDFPVYVGNLNGIQARFVLGELLPHAFRSFVAETKT